MRKSYLIILFLFLSLTINVNAANASYNIGDHVYYDPVSNDSCTYKNYWTTSNQNTTCYRFLVIEDSSSSSSTVKLMLNHAAVVDTYNNYTNQLNTIKSTWKNYTGTIDLISESEVKSIMKLDTTPGLTESIHASAGATFLPFRENSIYYINGTKTNTAGFWTKTTHIDDSNYAYTVTEYANNKPVLKTDKRGIRPVITVDKSKVTNDKAEKSLSVTLKYSYEYLTDKFDGYTYKQLQGFTMANDKLFFYSSNNSNPTKGILFGYGGTNYATSLGHIYEEMAHGNDMTYNSKTNQVLLVGAKEGSEVWVFSPSSFTTTHSVISKSTSGIGYDKFDNQYFIKTDASVIPTDTTMTTYKDSISVVHTETGQGLEYHNGYIYVPTFEVGSNYSSCPTSYQVYCRGGEFTGKIYVYNAKYNSDGTKSPNYGKLVETYTTPTDIGELETVSFKEDELYLGYAAQHYDTTNTYKIYTTSSDVIPGPSYSISYKDGKAVITSVEDLAPITGWTLSSNKKTLSKTLTTTAETVSICDRYGNCDSKTLKALDTITFSDNETTYTGDSITISSASAKSNSTISYKYYSDTSCTNEITSIVNAGTYSVQATSAGNSDYASNSKCIKLTVNKGTPIITAKKKEADYTGNEVIPDTPTATAPNKSTNVTLSYNFKYYSDSDCKTETTSTPKKVGNYYFKAISTQTENLNSGSSSCTSLNINKINPTLSIQSSITLPISKEIYIGYNTNSTGTVTCTSSDTSIATCAIENSKLKVNTLKTGTVNITLNQEEDSNYTSSNDTKITVTVTTEINDTNKPEVTITKNGDTSPTKTKDIKVNIKDNETYVKASQTVYYAFSQSNTIEPEYTKTLTLSTTDSTTQTITIPTTDMESLTGTYYLWIKEGILDSKDNATTKTVSNAYIFNNTNPQVTGIIVKSSKKVKGTITVNSLSKISKEEYSTDNTNYTTFTNNTFTDTNLNNSKYYIRVTDNLNQTSTIEINVENEKSVQLESYVKDSNNVNLVTNIIDLTNKNIIYNINIVIPSISEITDKYEKFSIKNTIDSNIEVESENVKVLNKSNEDSTSDFKIDYSDNTLTITPKDITSNSFYDETYNVQIQAKIKDTLDTSKTSSLISKVSLTVNDEQKAAKQTELLIKSEEYVDIPNTSLNTSKIKLLIGLTLMLIGSLVFIKEMKKDN